MMEFISSFEALTLWGRAILAVVVLSVGFLGYQLFQAFVYPYYFSPLRDLPGPKVAGYSLCNIFSKVLHDLTSKLDAGSSLLHRPHFPLLQVGPPRGTLPHVDAYLA
jgi:hypothetical protein